MPLQSQVAPIAFTQGLDTRTQAKLVVPGKWLSLINYSMSEHGTPQRRCGISPLVATANGNGLALHGDQLLTINGGYVSTVSTAATDIAVPTPGRLGYVNITKTEVRRSAGMQDMQDCASGGGFTLYVWREKSTTNVATGLSCSFVDEATGAHLLNYTTLISSATAISPRCVYASGAFFIFYMDGTSLYCRVILTSAPTTLGAQTALITSPSLKQANFDCCAFGAPTAPATAACMVVYGWADGVSDSVRTVRVDQLAAVPSLGTAPTSIFTQAQLPNATLTGLCCAAFSDTLTAAVFATSTGAATMAGLAGRCIDATWTATIAAKQINATVAATTSPCHVTACINDSFAGTAVGLEVFWDRVSEWGTNNFNPLRQAILDTSLNGVVSTLLNSATFGAGSLDRGVQGPFIAGKAFNSNGFVYLPVYMASVYSTTAGNNGNAQNSFFVMELVQDSSLTNAMVMVGKALYGRYGLASTLGSAPSIGTPSSCPEVTSGSFRVAAGELTILEKSGPFNVSPTGVVGLTMSPNFALSPIRAELGETTYMAGGSLTGFDGETISEHGFAMYPDGIGVSLASAGTGSMTAGVHRFVAIYEWVDASGQRHQSAPSLPTSYTATALDTVTVTVPTLLINQRNSSVVNIIVYMTAAGGITFYRVNALAGVYTVTANNMNVKDVGINVDSADAAITTNEALYTQPFQAGTTLANIAPGPCKALAVIQNRLFYDKSDKPGFFGYSQQHINNVGLQFSNDLEASVPSEAGHPTAFCQLDEKVIIFCRTSIFVMYGSAPNASGGYNNYSQPQDIGADVGCIEPRSVVGNSATGIMFQSEKGIYTLSRDLSTSFIGAGVQAFSQQPSAGGGTPQVYAAVLMPDRSEARFVLRFFNDEGPFLNLVYSFLTDSWSVHFGATGQNYSINDAVWWPAAAQGGTVGVGALVHIALTDGLNYDDNSAIADAVGSQAGLQVRTPFLTQAQTSWLKLSALEGFQRVRWLYLTMSNDSGAAVSATSTFAINVDYDDVPNLGAPGSYAFFANSATSAAGTSPVVDIRVKLRRQKCKSVSFTFVEAPNAATDQPTTGIEALALELGVKKGVNRLPAAQSVG